MKKSLIYLSLLLGVSITSFAQDLNSYYGKKITEDNAMPASEVVTKIGEQKSMSAKVEGTIESVCQMKGCWMTVKTTDGKTMRVTFRDYGFFVPKDIAGKNVIFEGTAQKTTTSIAELRHYAQDAGKSKEEIAKINQPEHAITFIADGVIVKK